jgi:hypothetical protein
MPNLILKHTAGTANAIQLLHGPGGLFNTAGLENPFLSAVIKPMGLGPYLPAFPSVYTDPYYGLITEIISNGESEPDYVCDPAPTGSMKSGVLSTTFGRVQQATKDIDLGTITMSLNNADRTDLVMLGNLLNPEDAGSGYPNQINEANVLNNAIKAGMVTAAFTMALKMNIMLWEGDPAAATTNGGHIPFNGLGKLVKTGYVDAQTGNVIPPADSAVMDGAFTTVGTDADIVGKLRHLMAYLEHLANATVGGATFAIVMRPKMWDVVSDVWHTKYTDEITAQIGASTASRLILDASQLTAMRDELKTSQLLPIGGVVYPVILDHGIHEVDFAEDSVNLVAGELSSTIYVIPLTIGPGMPVTYWEYLDWRVTQSLLAESGLQNAIQFWTDAARFVWTAQQTRMCISLQMRTEPRIVLRTPQLAGRIDDLIYVPTAPVFRQPHTTDLGYVAGGETTRAKPYA